MNADPEIRIVGDRVAILQGGDALFELSLEDWIQAIAGAADRGPTCGLLPTGVRSWRERGDLTAVALEIPPHARTVHWLEDDSGEAYGPRARFKSYFVAFPFVVLLVVFRRGALTGYQQLFYKTVSLDVDERLLLPNLYNVAKTPVQACWLCLQNLRSVTRLGWRRKIDAIVDHVFSAKFNRSSDVHEGNSYFTTMRHLDPRIRTLEAWQRATRKDPVFPLEVPWKDAGTTLTSEINRMLDRVAPPRRLRTARDLAGLATGAGRKGGRP